MPFPSLARNAAKARLAKVAKGSRKRNLRRPLDSTEGVTLDRFQLDFRFAGTAACSGDLRLGALAACAQLTCQMVAEAMGIEVESIGVEVEGELDLAGTLGVSKEVPVGFERIRTTFDIVAPEAQEEQLDVLRRKTERYCVVFQTLSRPPELEAEWT